MISFEQSPLDGGCLYTVYRRSPDRQGKIVGKRVVMCGSCIEADSTGELSKRNVMRARPVDGHACRRCAKIGVRA